MQLVSQKWKKKSAASESGNRHWLVVRLSANTSIHLIVYTLNVFFENENKQYMHFKFELVNDPVVTPLVVLHFLHTFHKDKQRKKDLQMKRAAINRNSLFRSLICKIH